MLVATLVVRIFCVTVLLGCIWVTLQIRRAQRHDKKGRSK